MRKRQQDKVDVEKWKNSYKVTNPAALRLMELLERCKCDICQKELKRLHDKYGIK